MSKTLKKAIKSSEEFDWIVTYIIKGVPTTYNVFASSYRQARMKIVKEHPEVKGLESADYCTL